MEPVNPPVPGQRSLVILLSLALVGFLFYQLRPILSPFIVGALIAYLGDPLVDRLQRYLGRSAAAMLAFLFISLVLIGLLVVMVPLLASQLDTLVRSLPAVYQWLVSDVLPQVQQRLGLPELTLPRLQVRQTLTENWQSIGRLLANFAGYVTGSSVNFLISLGNLVLIPVVAFYMLRDWDAMVQRVHRMLPPRWQVTAGMLARESDEVIGAFLRGQFLVMLALGIIYSAGLWLIDLRLAILIGTLAGLASIVPYLGFAVGILAASVAAMMQFQEWNALIGVGVVFAIGQMIESYLLTPNLVGERIGLHPVAVIFAIVAGGQLAGFTGVLLALPVAAVIMVFLRHIHDYYTGSSFYTEGGRSDEE